MLRKLILCSMLLCLIFTSFLSLAEEKSNKYIKGFSPDVITQLAEIKGKEIICGEGFKMCNGFMAFIPHKKIWRIDAKTGTEIETKIALEPETLKIAKWFGHNGLYAYRFTYNNTEYAYMYNPEQNKFIQTRALPIKH